MCRDGAKGLELSLSPVLDSEVKSFPELLHVHMVSLSHQCHPSLSYSAGWFVSEDKMTFLFGGRKLCLLLIRWAFPCHAVPSKHGRTMWIHAKLNICLKAILTAGVSSTCHTKLKTEVELLKPCKPHGRQEVESVWTQGTHAELILFTASCCFSTGNPF